MTMLISGFARKTGLSVDSVRFYIRLGLLQPELSQKGGSRPYQIFSASDVEKARIIRGGKMLGLSLKEIGAFLKTRRFDGGENDELIAFLDEQRERLTGRIDDLARLVAFVDTKIAWLREPGSGPAPAFPGDRQIPSD